jgi:ribosomal-protein-alanine N-acetyltransferase
MVAVVKPVIQVRGMRPEDLDDVSELEMIAYEFPWSPGIFRDCLKAGYPCWVLCVDGIFSGYGILSMGAGEAHLLNICVAPEQRGNGLGRRFLMRLIDIARWNAAERLFLEVRPSNPLAKQLYESVGFIEIGRRPRYYPARDGREEAIVMELDLVPKPIL